MNTHKCPVTGCDRDLPRHLLMCPRHWREVPSNLQREVNRTWKNAESGAGGVQSYMDARQKAVDSVNQGKLL